MASIHERTFKMKRDYVKLHSRGLGPVAIAKKFNLSVKTVYRHLGDIAKEAGVSRESLLEIPHKEHVGYEREFEPVEPVDATGFREHFNATLASMKKTSEVMEEYNAAQEKIAARYEKEEEAWQ